MSIYLAPGYTGRGIGRTAMKHLEAAAAAGEIRVLIGSLCSDNHASIRLPEGMGYRKVAHLSSVGEKFGRILDVVMYQKLLG